MALGRVALVLPAYNEAEAIGGFLDEVVAELRPHVESLTVVVADDCSTDGTASALRELSLPGADLVVLSQPRNRGHGPTAIAAYLGGLSTSAEVIVHVDGDGQFHGYDFPRVLAALDGADVVHGVRTGRTDPWFRRVVTACVGLATAVWTGRRVPDVNTPLRVYRRNALLALLSRIPNDALVPHVHFSLIERSIGLRVVPVRVESIPRRGASSTGTMWGVRKRPPLLPPRRLVDFVRRAGMEIVRYRLLHRAPATAAVETAA